MTRREQNVWRKSCQWKFSIPASTTASSNQLRSAFLMKGFPSAVRKIRLACAFLCRSRSSAASRSAFRGMERGSPFFVFGKIDLVCISVDLAPVGRELWKNDIQRNHILQVFPCMREKTTLFRDNTPGSRSRFGEHLANLSKGCLRFQTVRTCDVPGPLEVVKIDRNSPDGLKNLAKPDAKAIVLKPVR
jgi:hypothetical protein